MALSTISISLLLSSTARPSATSFSSWIRQFQFCLGHLLFSCAVILCLATVVRARPQSCIQCNRSDMQGNDPSFMTYEKFRFEHQVTRVDAIIALQRLNTSFFEGKLIIAL